MPVWQLSKRRGKRRLTPIPMIRTLAGTYSGRNSPSLSAPSRPAGTPGWSRSHRRNTVRGTAPRPAGQPACGAGNSRAKTDPGYQSWPGLRAHARQASCSARRESAGTWSPDSATWPNGVVISAGTPADLAAETKPASALRSRALTRPSLTTAQICRLTSWAAAEAALDAASLAAVPAASPTAPHPVSRRVAARAVAGTTAGRKVMPPAYRRSLPPGRDTQDAVQQPVPEFAFGIMPGGKRTEICEAGVQGLPVMAVRREQLAPVRPRAKGAQGLLKDWKEGLHLRLQRLPGEMERDALLAVERAEPELVRGAGADLRDEQQGHEAFCQRADGLEGGWGVFDGKDELPLEFVSVARRELVPEVRQPVQPQAGFVQLRRAVFRRHFR